ncbi:MAG: OPT/YSL family transporter [Myxococcota bacterium]
MSESVSSEKPYRELTVSAVVFGVLIGAMMTAAFVYVALKLGFTLAGSTVAAILGFAVLRGIFRKGSIVENNINQTVASGVNSAASGVAFTLPALFILGSQYEEVADFSVFPILLSAIGGAFLGIVVIIPLRKQMVELERLRFPSGIAVASLLKSPGAGIRQAILLGAGFLVAAPFHVLTGFELLPEELTIGEWVGIPSYIPIAIGVSFASLGAGLLSGKGGLPFVFGGMLAWWIIAPVAVSLGWVPSPADMGIEGEVAGYESWATWSALYAEMLRPLGIV